MSRFDASAWVGMWPFTMSAPTSLPELVASLQAVGISGAAVSPIASVLGPEPSTANMALIAEARSVPNDFDARVVPVIDPSLPGWEGDLDAALVAGSDLIGAVKIVPNHHGYEVDREAAVALAQAVAGAGLGLCLQMRMLDERAHHPLMKVPGVPIDGVVRLSAAVPELRILACGIYQSELAAIVPAGNVSVELSSVESGDVLTNAIQAVGAERLMLGTHAPVYYPAAGVAKVANTAFEGDVTTQIGQANAAGFFAFP
jgi:hypothetical protein